MSVKRAATPEEFEEIRARLRGLSHAEKAALVARTRTITERKQEREGERVAVDEAPKTDDELHAAIIRETGYDIPRVAVCDDHCAPFDMIADGFFHRVDGILNLKSREAGGTLNASILQYMLCKYLPGHEGVQFGAIRDQAEKAFRYVKQFTEETVKNPDGTTTRRVKPEIDGEPLQKRIAWKAIVAVGSLLQIIVGSEAGVNSPHPNTVHADEVDLMKQAVIDQAANMSSGTTLPDGTRIPALDLVVSTRKTMRGPMQKLIKEIEEAEEKGFAPSYKLYAYCVYDVAAEVPSCRCAPPEQRLARLVQLGRDPDELCDCDRQVKGEWSEGAPRSLQSVCRGKFFRSRGWMAHEDVARKFRKNTQATWEAEMECRRPMADGLYLPGWTRERFVVVGWQPRPEYGNVWQGVDWGGSAESAVLWIQGPLRTPVKVTGAPDEGGRAREVLVPARAYVTFDELIIGDIGAGKLADQVVAKEVGWRRIVPGFRVSARFADMAGKQQRLDWREHKPQLLTSWYLPNRDFDETVKCVQGLVEDARYFIDSRCSRHMDDTESWRRKNGREVHDESTHSWAAGRYCLTNTEAIERRKGTSGAAADPEAVAARQRQGELALAGVGVSSRGAPQQHDAALSDEWSWRGGQPASTGRGW